MTKPNTGISFRQVVKRYGGAHSPLVVRGIDFDVPKGTLTTILGPSGCGKTTTLRMIAGLETPSGGQIFIDGRDVTQLGPAERNVSMVFQSYALFPHMTVLGNVAYGLNVSGVPKAEVQERARAAMAIVGLGGYEERYPAELSGGQQQRVALARALVLEPSVLLFDEPLSNLDARLRRSMREEIRSLQQRLKLTVAYVTHDQSEALAVSDQIIVMDGGLIAQAGSPRELYESPKTEFVAGFMGEAVLLDGTCEAEGAVRLGPLTLSTPRRMAPGPVKVAIRPEAWAVQSGHGQGLTGTVAKAAYLGSFQELTVDTSLGAIFVVSSDAQGSWNSGDAVTLKLAQRGVSVVAV
ncbi:ABC transporter ATP-binding protein [uncultured Rhodoferax sp.]|uniref:ABC transporter ATP-binding protein n=1 Tax=uncultured Rhodoferax sp. TaxID=223188 RepID=UPI0025EE68FC|nr:ABC transporter ATP-binding protein [uncultured Rhodoferax sp.]